MRNIFFKTGMICFCGMLICPLLPGMEAFAGEETGNWRGTYDEVMLWLNFVILAFVIIKFGKKPIMAFLNGRKNEVAQEIRQIEKEKEEITSKIQETFKTLDESESRFESLKNKIIEQGERKKQEIIEDARQQSQMMMDTAKQKVENQIRQAKSTFRAELVDSAVALASEKLPGEITPEDNQKFTEDYLSGAFTK
ncbi:MAG: hypothetical protein B6245_05950 [Desulfobacteraceae bacterium 4572_88]|nr:MAG: hypothetical protein B6245_05950 [Desulfobacteraceae bacterium 4572_88]